MSNETTHHIWLALHRIEDHLESEATWEERQLYLTLHGYKRRVDRLHSALIASGPIARQMIAVKLHGIDLTMIWNILISALHDVALYYCSSVVAGTTIGAAAGAMAAGVGAVPGAGIGMAAGMQLGNWIMAFLGLKMLAEGLTETAPQVFRSYMDGFHAAWGPSSRQDRFDARYPTGSASSETMAAYSFAQGHVLMIVGMLTALVAYLTRGKSEEALLQAIRESKRLGPKMADWVAENKDRLLTHPALRPKVGQRTIENSDDLRTNLRRRLPARSKGSEAANTVAQFDRAKVQQQLIDRLGSNLKTNPLRQEYEQKVAALSSYADRIRPNMTQDELRDLAEEANQARRQLGIEYKDLTPGPLRDFIYDVNQSRYGDPLGPTVDYLVDQGRTYTDIIKSAARPNPDVDTLLSKFGDWLQQKPDSYIQKYAPLIGQ